MQDDDGKEESKVASKSDEAEAGRPSAEDGSETKVAEAIANGKGTEMADVLEKVTVPLCSRLCCFHCNRNPNDTKCCCQAPVAVDT